MYYFRKSVIKINAPLKVNNKKNLNSLITAIIKIIVIFINNDYNSVIIIAKKKEGSFMFILFLVI